MKAALAGFSIVLAGCGPYELAWMERVPSPPDEAVRIRFGRIRIEGHPEVPAPMLARPAHGCWEGAARGGTMWSLIVTAASGGWGLIFTPIVFPAGAVYGAVAAPSEGESVDVEARILAAFDVPAFAEGLRRDVVVRAEAVVPGRFLAVDSREEFGSRLILRVVDIGLTAPWGPNPDPVLRVVMETTLRIGDEVAYEARFVFGSEKRSFPEWDPARADACAVGLRRAREELARRLVEELLVKGSP